MRGEEIKTAAAGAGVNVNTGWRWLRPLGFLRMYVTAAERQDLIARRRDAERAAMLPGVPCYAVADGKTYIASSGKLVKLEVAK
jgi:hypothetical protein